MAIHIKETDKAGPRCLTTEDIFQFRLVGSVQIIPGTDTVLYVEQQARPEENDYRGRIMRVAPGEQPMPFTTGPHDSNPQVSPDGRHLAFLSKRSGQTQIWLMDLECGGEAAQLTQIQGGVVECVWHPSSQRIAFTARLDRNGVQPEHRPEEGVKDPAKKHTEQVKVITELAHKMDGVGYYGDRRSEILVIDAKPGAEPVQLTDPPYSHHDLAWTPDGERLLFVARRGPDYDREAFQQQIYVMAADPGSEPRPITPDDGYSCQMASMAPDGQTVVVLASRVAELGYDNPSLYRTTLTGGALIPLAHAWDRPFSDVSVHDMPAPGSGGLVFSADGTHLYGLTSRNGATHLARVSLADGTVTVLTSHDQVYYSYAVASDGKWAALATTEPGDPSTIVRLNLDEGTEDVLAAPNAELLRGLTLSMPRRFHTRAEDGPPIDGWVIEPVDREPGHRYSAILEIHGGPMMMYAQAFFFEFQWLAANGYGVVLTNPRGSQGYGHEFCRAIQHEWGNEDLADIYAGLDYAIQQESWIDPGRLGVAGGSYGGFMTNWIVSHTDRFKAAVTMRSIADWRVMVGTGDGGWHWIRRAGGVPPWEDDTWYRQQSPITYVANISTPLLIEHQEGDLRCPIEQGEMLYAAVKFLDRAPVKFVRYPGEFHGMSRNGKPWHRVHRLQQMTDWFDEHLKS